MSKRKPKVDAVAGAIMSSMPPRANGLLIYQAKRSRRQKAERRYHEDKTRKYKKWS